MTVKELIAALKELPEDAVVYYEDGEYNGSYSGIYIVEYNKEAERKNYGF